MDNDMMDPSVIPIAMPKVNWSALLGGLQKLGFPKVSGILDSHDINSDDLPALTLVLSSLFNGESNVVDAVKNAGHVLQHTHVSFLINVHQSVRSEVVMNTDLKISGNDKATILSGTLDKWKEACIVGTSHRHSRCCRLLFNMVIAWLERGSLVHLWWGYSKQDQKDGTYSLVDARRIS